eukprot:6198180-Pyramimonas_sp.AAC.1
MAGPGFAGLILSCPCWRTRCRFTAPEIEARRIPRGGRWRCSQILRASGARCISRCPRRVVS